MGAPKWSPDGKRIIYYALSREDTYGAHSSFGSNGIQSWIASVDFETGSDVQIHVENDEVLMVNPQWIGNSSTIGYLNKGTEVPGINYTSVNRLSPRPFSKSRDVLDADRIIVFYWSGFCQPEQ